MKSKNNPKMNANKIRACITLTPETHEKIREISLNLSSFVERALNWLYSHIKSGDIRLLTGNNLILSPDLQNKLNFEWSRRDSNTRPPACKAGVITGADLENKPNSDDLENGENFSTPAREEAIARGAKGEPYMSIAEFMKGKEAQFDSYCLHTKPATKKEATRKGYIRALSVMDEVYTPQDVANLGLTTKTNIRALGKFYSFIETKYYAEGYNGYSDAQWRGNQKETSYAVGSRAGSKTKDLSNDEILDGYNKLEKDEAKFVYALTVYSGARSAHLARFLRSPDKKIEKLPNGIIRADVRELSEGTKDEVYFYFPAELEKEIREYKSVYSPRYIERLISHSGTDERKINESSIRKWHFNVMLNKVRIPEITANAIQGRAQRGIDAKHYFDAAESGRVYYPDVAELVRGVIPPDIVKETVKTSKPEQRVYHKPPAHPKVSAEDKKILTDCLRKGMTVAQIIDHMKSIGKKTSKESLRKLRAELAAKGEDLKPQTGTLKPEKIKAVEALLRKGVSWNEIQEREHIGRTTLSNISKKMKERGVTLPTKPRGGGKSKK